MDRNEDPESDPSEVVHAIDCDLDGECSCGAAEEVDRRMTISDDRKRTSRLARSAVPHRVAVGA